MSLSPWQPQSAPPKRDFGRHLLALLLIVAAVGGLSALALIYGQQQQAVQPSAQASPTVAASGPTPQPTVPQRAPGLGGPQAPEVTPVPTAVPPSPTAPQATPTPSPSPTPVDPALSSLLKLDQA